MFVFTFTRAIYCSFSSSIYFKYAIYLQHASKLALHCAHTHSSIEHPSNSVFTFQHNIDVFRVLLFMSNATGARFSSAASRECRDATIHARCTLLTFVLFYLLFTTFNFQCSISYFLPFYVSRGLSCLFHMYRKCFLATSCLLY